MQMLFLLGNLDYNLFLMEELCLFITYEMEYYFRIEVRIR